MAEGKRMKKAREGLEPEALYPLDKGVEMLKERAGAKFAEGVDMAINLGVDPRHADQLVRGICHLPHGTGREIRVAVFARDEKAEAAKKAGADIVGAEDLAAQVEKGKIDFDRCIATPDLMPIVGKLGKVLGPRGLMPNPKTGTVSDDMEKAVREIKKGALAFRVEKAGIIHAGVGRAGFSHAQIFENVSALMGEIMKAKPSGAKGVYVRKVALSATMGPAIRIDPKSAIAAAAERNKKAQEAAS